ncbi:MAG: SMP-30/gluconolactonase/LRE family protein [Lacipirellulaceae bacterium]
MKNFRFLSLVLVNVLAFFCSTTFAKEYKATGEIERLDSAMDALVPPDAKIEVLAEGFTWSEGPVWIPQKDAISDGFLLFSDVPNNVVHRWDEQKGLSDFLKPSGFTGEATNSPESGSNGLSLDGEGGLLLCQHGDRRLALLDVPISEAKPADKTLIDNYEGKRFNSPNDLAVHSSGAISFTDPPYGLHGKWDDPRKELDFQGVYRLGTDGKVTLLTKELHAPNGIALSPDEKTLYVAQSDPRKPVIIAYPIQEDGTIGKGRVFFDASELAKDRPGMPDGMKVDPAGNLFATGPGGVLIISPEGKHLGTIRPGGKVANCAFGENGKRLYMTNHQRLCRVQLQ